MELPVESMMNYFFLISVFSQNMLIGTLRYVIFHQHQIHQNNEKLIVKTKTNSRFVFFVDFLNFRNKQCITHEGRENKIVRHLLPIRYGHMKWKQLLFLFVFFVVSSHTVHKFL